MEEDRAGDGHVERVDVRVGAVGAADDDEAVAGAGDGEPGIVLGLDALMSVSKVAMRTTPGDAKMKFFP